jgi:hypothetical protein
MKNTMSQDERALRNAIERVEATEAVIQHEIAEVIGTPTRRQKELLEDLVRLQQSLRGPEDLLDRRGYSRPFPPRPSRQRKEEERDRLAAESARASA